MGQRLTRRGRVWYCYVYVHEDGAKRRIQRSTGCVDRAAAEKVAREWERDAADPDHARTRTVTLSDAVGSLIEHRRELVAVGKRSAATIGFYLVKLGHIIRILEGDPDAGTYRPMRLATLRHRHIDDYVSARRREGAADTTIAKETRALHAVLVLAKRRGTWRGDPDEFIPADVAAEYKPRERWLPPAELQALLSQLIPDRAARVAFAVATGANLSETDHALREDVDMARGRVLLRGTKRPTRWRTVVVALPWQVDLLRFALEHGEGEDGRIFRHWANDSTDLKLACEAAGIARCSTNDLRRSFGHWMRGEGVPLELLAPTMGHATTAMVQRVYGKLDADEIAARMRATLGDRCITGASHSPASDGPGGRGVLQNPRGNTATPDTQTSTPGFIIPGGVLPKPRKYASKQWESRAAASRVHQGRQRKDR